MYIALIAHMYIDSVSQWMHIINITVSSYQWCYQLSMWITLCLLTRKALSWENSTATMQSLSPLIPQNGQPFQKGLPSVALLNLSALCLKTNQQIPCSLSPTVATKWTLKVLTDKTLKLLIWLIVNDWNLILQQFCIPYYIKSYTLYSLS